MKYPNLKNEKLVALDIETKDPSLKKLGPGPRRDAYVLGVALATKDKEWYFKSKEMLFKYINDLNKTASFIVANGLYDFDFLQYKGIIPHNRCYDVQFAEPLLDENKRRYSLDSLGIHHLDKHKKTDKLEAFCKAHGLKGNPQNHLEEMPFELQEEYATWDARLTYDVFEKQLPLIKNEGLEDIFNMECDLMPMLLQMRKNGVRINTRRLSKLHKVYPQRIKDIQNELNDIAGFEVRINAARDLEKVFKAKGLKIAYTEKGNPSFNAKILESHGSKLSKKILDLRKLDKTYGTFVTGLNKFIIDGRIHALFHPLRTDDKGTVSGRFSGQFPNLQNIPSRNPEIKKDIRGLFMPEVGEDFYRLDYSQIELRIFAHYARGYGADEIRKRYKEDPEVDYHQICADMIGVPRKKAKSINFGVIYGMGVGKMCIELGLEEAQGKQFIYEYYNKFPFLKKTSNDAQYAAMNRGYVKTIMGRKRRFPDKRFAYRALNSVVQGSAADVMKKAMLDSYNAGVFNSITPLITVHDELDLSVPRTKEGKEAVKELKNICENVIKFKVPLYIEVERGNNWADMKKINLSA